METWSNGLLQLSSTTFLSARKNCLEVSTHSSSASFPSEMSVRASESFERKSATPDERATCLAVAMAFRAEAVQRRSVKFWPAATEYFSFVISSLPSKAEDTRLRASLNTMRCSGERWAGSPRTRTTLSARNTRRVVDETGLAQLAMLVTGHLLPCGASGRSLDLLVALFFLRHFRTYDQRCQASAVLLNM